MNTASSLTRFATYGTFPPGRENHHVVAEIAGRWLKGEVEGETVAAPEGRWRGFAGFVQRPGGPRLEVFVLESDELPVHWTRLDAFEGPAFARIEVPVWLEGGGRCLAQIYALRAGGRPSEGAPATHR